MDLNKVIEDLKEDEISINIDGDNKSLESSKKSKEDF